MGFKEDFYGILDAHKDDRGWASDLCQRSGMSQDALSKIIHRKTKAPKIETIAQIVDGIGMCLAFGKSQDCSDLAEELARSKKIIQTQQEEIIGLRANVKLLQEMIVNRDQNQGEEDDACPKSCA